MSIALRNRSSRRNPWSIPIDYVKAIAEDQRFIAECELLIRLSVDMTPVETAWLAVDGNSYTLGQWVMFANSEARAAAVGISNDDVRCMRYVCDVDGDVDDSPGAYRRGEAALKKISEGAEFRSPEKLVKILRKARASLARHLRNQAKYGMLQDMKGNSP